MVDNELFINRKVCEVMKECIEFKEVGICLIDIKRAIKKFTLLNRIVQIRDEFYLLEYTPKCRRKIKVRISEEDANKLINHFGLKPFRNDLFKNIITYVPTT